MRQSVVLLSLYLFGASCNNAALNYPGPSYTSAVNAAEISKLDAFYHSLREGPKKTMTSYILKNLAYQYQLRYILIDTSRNKLTLRDPVSSDSLDAWRSRDGSHLQVDTIWDKDVIKAEFVIQLLSRIDSLRKIAPFKNIPLAELCEYILPYRVNNEELYPYKSIFEKRYLPYLTDVLLANSDTLRNLKSYLDPYFSSLIFPSLNSIDFISAPGFESVIRQRNNYIDFEDVIVLNVHALRAIGVPCTYEYIPLQKRKPNSLIKINMFDNEGKSHFNLNGSQNWPYRFLIAKAYRNTFDLTKAVNPFTGLKKMGVPEEDIPFALNIPKMIDITSERTVVTDLTVPISDSLRTKKVIYIAGLANGTWKILSWGLVDSAASTATFRNMGVDMLYHLADSHKGKTSLIGSPFTVDSSGKRHTPAGLSGVSYIDITNSEAGTPFQAGMNYSLFYWKKTDWLQIMGARPIHDTMHFKIPFPGAIYKLVAGRKVSIFTLKEDEQEWW